MGDVATTATAIVAAINTIPDAGVVFDYQPLPVNGWPEFVDSFTVTVASKRVIRAWTVVYLGEDRLPVTAANQGIGSDLIEQRAMRWKIRGHFGWTDATSDKAFRDLVEAVANALDARHNLGGSCYTHDPVDVNYPNDGAGIVLGDILCHYAEVTMTTYHQLNVTMV